MKKQIERAKKLAQESKQYFRTPLSEMVYLRTYARWIDEEGRRETWIETVDRYMAFMQKNLGNSLKENEYNEIRHALLHQEVMPSMRLMQFSGKAAEYSNVCAYNCSYIAPKTLHDLAEVMYVSMCGVGVGFSVESQNLQHLPSIKFQAGEMLPTFVIEDNRESWCDAFKTGLKTWFDGKDISFDFSKCRPLGARLKTLGGRSSGPDPLKSLLEFTRARILEKQGRRLSHLNVHDILCKIGEVVVSGGVRRSAMISLSDLDDGALRDAKKGPFYYTEPQRAYANNSAVYLEKPSNELLLEEWLALIKSGTGERGIFNRGHLIKTLPERRIKLWRELDELTNERVTGLIGTNPCGEIILRSKQFCNLSEVISRPEDSEETLLRKVKIAAIIGTYQATLTHFKYLSKSWRENCERERLLGVSITGQWDCPLVRKPEILQKLKKHAVAVNQKYAKRFGINPATAVTCVKPSGNVSLVTDCSSGMHPRHAPYYIRRVRVAATDPLFKMLKHQGVPYHPEVGQTSEDAMTFVLDFPIAAPKGAVYRDDLSALDQLEHWKKIKLNYTEHNPSVTISVGDDEWITVVNWLNKNWDILGGLSFLPRHHGVYRLAPYETISQKQYKELQSKIKNVDFTQLVEFEYHDEAHAKESLLQEPGCPACQMDY